MEFDEFDPAAEPEGALEAAWQVEQTIADTFSDIADIRAMLEQQGSAQPASVALQAAWAPPSPTPSPLKGLDAEQSEEEEEEPPGEDEEEQLQREEDDRTIDAINGMSVEQIRALVTQISAGEDLASLGRRFDALAESDDEDEAAEDEAAAARVPEATLRSRAAGEEEEPEQESLRKTVTVERARSVADSLTARAASYRNKVEDMRNERDRRELQQLRDKPKINARSKRLAESSSRVSIAERGERDRLAKEKREAEIRKALEEREVAEVRSSPTINQTSQRLAGKRTVKDMEAWRRTRDNRVAVQRHLKTMAEQQACSHAPQISKKSEKIVRKKQLEGGSPAKPVAERLHAHAQELDEKRQRAEVAAKKAIPHKPKLSERSSALARPGGKKHAHTRLYTEAKAIESRKQRAAVAAAEAAKVDPTTGQELYVPKVRKAPKNVGIKGVLKEAERRMAPTTAPPAAATGKQKQKKRSPLDDLVAAQAQRRQQRQQERSIARRRAEDENTDFVRRHNEAACNSSYSQAEAQRCQRLLEDVVLHFEGVADAQRALDEAEELLDAVTDAAEVHVAKSERAERHEQRAIERAAEDAMDLAQRTATLRAEADEARSDVADMRQLIETHSQLVGGTDTPEAQQVLEQRLAVCEDELGARVEAVVAVEALAERHRHAIAAQGQKFTAAEEKREAIGQRMVAERATIVTHLAGLTRARDEAAAQLELARAAVSLPAPSSSSSSPSSSIAASSSVPSPSSVAASSGGAAEEADAWMRQQQQEQQHLLQSRAEETQRQADAWMREQQQQQQQQQAAAEAQRQAEDAWLRQQEQEAQAGAQQQDAWLRQQQEAQARQQQEFAIAQAEAWEEDQARQQQEDQARQQQELAIAQAEAWEEDQARAAEAAAWEAHARQQEEQARIRAQAEAEAQARARAEAHAEEQARAKAQAQAEEREAQAQAAEREEREQREAQAHAEARQKRAARSGNLLARLEEQQSEIRDQISRLQPPPPTPTGPAPPRRRPPPPPPCA